MRKLYAITAVGSALGTQAAPAQQLVTLSTAQGTPAPEKRGLDLRVGETRDPNVGDPLTANMLVGRDVGPESAVGLGLDRIYVQRTASGPRADRQIDRSGGPALTFKMKF